MKKLLLYLIFISAFLFISTFSKGQLSNYIFGINLTNTNGFYFSKVEISTGTITNYQPTLMMISNEFSSCVNVSESKYYFCTGKILNVFDVSAGSVLNIDTLPLSTTATFTRMQYNPCDSYLYGILDDSPNQVSFVKYNLNTRNFTFISSLGSSIFFAAKCLSTLNSENGTIIFNHDSAITVLDIASGQVVFNSPIINLPWETFQTISMYCKTNEIIGMSKAYNCTTRFLSKIDPQTGIVSHITNSTWTSGLISDVHGGIFINQKTAEYYFSTGHELFGVDIGTGNINFQKIINTADLLYIQYFSDCSCISSDINESVNENLSVYPTMFSNEIKVNCDKPGEKQQFVLVDITARKVIETELNNFAVINTEQLPAGPYIYYLINKMNVLKTGIITKY